jgi:TonB-dependent starch-binding outer membrane protein SusC
VNFILMNLGEVSNKGIEVSLNTVNLNTKNGLRWTTDIVFSKNKEAIVDIDGTGNSNLANLWFIGQPIRVYYNYESAGIYQYSDTMKGGYLAEYLWKKGSNKSNLAYRAGRIHVVDKNRDTLITQDDKLILGYDNADWTGSITNTVSFKGFELSAMLYIRKGGMYRSPRPGLVGRFQSNRVNYWTPTNPSDEYQQPTRTSDVPVYWEALGYRDGSFARIRNISLSYRFGQSILSKLKATSLTVYVNAVNPFLFHDKSDYDPETIPYAEQFTATTNNTGPNSMSYRSIVFGVRLGL